MNENARPNNTPKPTHFLLLNKQVSANAAGFFER